MPPSVPRSDDPHARYEALDPFPFDVLVVLALLDRPTSRSAWRSRAAELGLSPDPRRRLTSNPQLEPALTELRSGGVVFEAHDGHFAVSPEVTLAVLESAHRRGRLVPLLGAMPRDLTARRWGLSGHWSWDTQLRVAAIEGRTDDFETLLRWAPAPHGRDLAVCLRQALGPSPHPRWLAMMPENKRDTYVGALLEAATLDLVAVGDGVLEAAARSGERNVRMKLARWRVLTERDDASEDLGPLPKWGPAGLALIRAFVAGDYAEAAREGDAALGAMTGRKHPGLDDVEGVLHALATAASCGDDPKRVETLGRLVDAGRTRGGRFRLHYAILEAVRDRLRNGDEVPPSSPDLHPSAVIEGSWVAVWTAALASVWLGGGAGPKPRPWHDRLRHWVDHAERAGARWIARELEAVSEVIGKREGTAGLVRQYRPPSPWEAALAGLEAIAERAGSQPGVGATREVVWELDASDERVFVRARARERGGRAKKGARVSISAVIEGEGGLATTATDRQIAWQLRSDHPGYAPRADQELLRCLVGHPRVVDPQGVPLAVEEGQPAIRTRVRNGKIEVQVDPPRLALQAVVIDRPDPGTVRVFERAPELARVLDVLARQSMAKIPEREQSRLQRALVRIAIATGTELLGDLAAVDTTQVADPRVVVLLERRGEGLTVVGRVAPFGIEGPMYGPGQGPARVMREVEGAPVVGRIRDLALERRNLDVLLGACPTLAGSADGELVWAATTLPEALDVLAELDALGDAVVLAWPHGRPLVPPERPDAVEVRVSVEGARGWLAVDGELRVEDAAVMTFADLLAARVGDRYVALSRGRFLRLTQDLAQRLDALAALAHVHAGQVRLSDGLLPGVQALTEGLGKTTFDESTRARIRAWARLQEQRSRVPRSFRAKLRNYQREGFDWLWRRAEAGMGGCLADDMGLGKTVQALALLVQRSRKGPAVVFCPTSVLLNWEREAQRFAPSLNSQVLARADDREGLLASLGPGDLLLCSYGLLTQTREALAEAHFATAIFDEAHALKNVRSQRSRAARDVQATVRIALTGTPIENNLTELWSLFEVLVPGLLGSKAEFEERFAAPIAKGNRGRAQQLREVLQHFVLRRTKQQVLAELPPRTDLQLDVEMPSQAQAFYEAVRRRALAEVAATRGPGRRIRLLAEIGRLRQAAIDPRLVDPEAGPAGAKIDVLLGHLEALRDEGHRALVFTQFLRSMELVREGLQRSGIAFTEFDGTTPATERARRIEAFQQGGFDVFLLSLRAGGLGINLTEADYVFHLDPWWNPAVEDQATDRVHRIGQVRPVTVYRMISTGTIEARIMRLHEAKRSLAEDLLVGLEGGKALDEDELVALLAE